MVPNGKLQLAMKLTIEQNELKAMAYHTQRPWGNPTGPTYREAHPFAKWHYKSTDIFALADGTASNGATHWVGFLYYQAEMPTHKHIALYLDERFCFRVVRQQDYKIPCDLQNANRIQKIYSHSSER